MFKQLIIAGLVLLSPLSLSSQAFYGKVSARDTITDKELEVPEQIEKNFDELLVDWKRNMRPSHLCTSNYDIDIAYPDSAYINRLYSLPTVMELAYNPVVKSYIDMYTGRMRSSVEYFLGKSHYYFPIFEQILDKYGLPLELKYLPIIESALNPTIVSRAGATGLWQFMIGTGKMYDLEVNSLVDERRDPLRSTDAAARYLKDLFNIYGDWNLVIAAYNCGPGNVNKAIKRSGGQSDYWAIYPYLPKETRGYVPAFIAAAYVMNYSSFHNICPFDYKYNYSTDTVVVDRYLHFQQLADVLNISIDEIRNLNPQFKNDIIPGEFKKYHVTLPSTSASDFEISKDSVYTYRTNEFLAHRKVVNPAGGSSVTTKIRYKVKRGESLASIASKHGVTSKQIRQWNRLKSNKLRTGQILAINNKKVVKPEENKIQSTNSQNINYAENKVITSTNNNSEPSKQTDERDASAPTLLAEYFNRYAVTNINVKKTDASVEVSSNAILDDNTESEDQEARTPDEIQTIYHKVRIGETVSLIASKYNVDKNDIAKWNKLKSAVPKIGQRLVIHLPSRPDKLVEDVEENRSDEVGKTSEYLAVRSQSVSQSTVSQYREYGPSLETVSSPSSENKPNVGKNNPSLAKGNPPAKKKTATKRQSTVYTVKKGDTLSNIANKIGGKMTTKDLMRANNLRSDKLKIGQKLRIPR